MPKKKISSRKASKKSYFLPPSSPHRLPLPVLFFISLSFFAILIGLTIYLSPNTPKHGRMMSNRMPSSRSGTSSGIVNQAYAQPLPTTPMPTVSLGYCLRVPILMYHHVQPMAEATKLGHAQLTVDRDIFEQHLAYFNDHGYKTITLEAVVDALRAHASLPTKSIVLTFDDGYIDSYEYVFPLLKQYNEIGNFMIPTGLIENTDYMSWDQVKEMADDSHVSLYNHTWSHAALGQSSKEKIDFELATSRQEFMDHLGKMSPIFAYPYGSYSDLAITELRSSGYIAAVTTEPGTLQCDSYLMKLKRDHVGNVPMSFYGY